MIRRTYRALYNWLDAEIVVWGISWRGVDWFGVGMVFAVPVGLWLFG